MKRISLLVLIAISFTGPSLAQSNNTRVARTPAVGASGYDGAWTFETTTTVGNCPALVPNYVTIRDNRVASTDGASNNPWGYVESDGTIVARFSDQGGHLARANGHLRGTDGNGAWSSSTDMCGGTWHARRSNTDHASQ